MNSHLNIFRTYTKENRSFQLENDLTRALAICMQEDPLFFNLVLQDIVEPQYFKELFSDIDSENRVSINIQKNANEVSEFEKVYAVSLSEFVMSPAHFWSQKNDFAYDPICDIVIKVNGVLIVIEAKRDNVDCTAQLYNQAYNICAKNEVEFGHENVVAHDLNWNKLMELAVKVYSFEKATSVPNRFLKDLIDLVKLHNFRWLPEASIYSLSPDNTNGISRRIDSAINELCKAGNYDKLDYPDRLGLRFKKPWAQEILFSVNKTGDLDITIYPGNTKAQGEFIFHNDPKLKKEFDIGSNSYELNVDYHIKLTSFQKFFTGLWFNDDDLKSNLYTKENFWHYCGRNKRDEHWVAVENLFDTFFEEKYNWRSKCHWQEKVIESGRNQFDLSFGYEISIQVPFEELRKVDRSKSDLSGLTNLIESAYREFEAIYTV